MPHENSRTVAVDGKYYVISQPDGRILMGPFDNQADADYRAKIRSGIHGELEQGVPSDAGPLGLGDLGDLMDEGFQKGMGPSERLPEGHDDKNPSLRPDPSPTEWGPIDRTPDGGLQETGYGTYTSQTMPTRPAPGPLPLPENRRLSVPSMEIPHRVPSIEMPNRMDRFEIPGRPQMPRPGLGQLAQGPQLDPRLQQMLDQAERGKQVGPSQQYGLPGAAPKPAPVAPAAPATPLGGQSNPNLPGGGPRPGETEEQYIRRIIRGG